MGEYFRAVNFTRREFIDPFDNEPWTVKRGWWLHPGHPAAHLLARWAPTDDVRFIGDEGAEIQHTGSPGEVTPFEFYYELDNEYAWLKLRG